MIEISHLSCAFQHGEALHDVSLTIPTGSVFGLVGLNGAGKTTLIRHLIGGLKPQQGTVRVLGMDPAEVPEVVLQRVGYVSEEDSLPRWMRVDELIKFHKAIYHRWDDEFCDELLDRFSLDRRQKLADLSKGGRARAGLLVAIAHHPDVLILDEPSYGLDPIARQDILEAVIRTTAGEGRTVLFSSHLLDEIMRVCDTVGVISQGRLLETIAIDALPDRYFEVLGDGDITATIDKSVQGLFGWHTLGREWSVVVDKKVFRGESDLHPVIDRNMIREVRSMSLDRWFQARASLASSRAWSPSNDTANSGSDLEGAKR